MLAQSSGVINPCSAIKSKSNLSCHYPIQYQLSVFFIHMALNQINNQSMDIVVGHFGFVLRPSTTATPAGCDTRRFAEGEIASGRAQLAALLRGGAVIERFRGRDVVLTIALGGGDG
jgi:hypothetical protein